MRLALVCFYCLCVFLYVFYFIATMSFAGYFLSVFFCLLSMLISDSRFDLVWFRLSCDHGWIRSGSVNVRKQQQQQQQQQQLLVQCSGMASTGNIPTYSRLYSYCTCAVGQCVLCLSPCTVIRHGQRGQCTCVLCLYLLYSGPAWPARVTYI